VITAGVDLASQPENTGVCRLLWSGGTVRVEQLAGHLDDRGLEALLRSPAEKIGLDVPFGWPRRFVEWVCRHSEMRPVEGGDTKRLTHRATDHWVHEKFGRWPLSVSTDKIAYPALRAAPLLQGMPRDGSGAVVEVYPAVALRIWGVMDSGYKGRGERAQRARIVDQLLNALPGIRDGAFDAGRAVADDNCLDALVAGLVARAAACGLCEPIPLVNQADALVEGWIHVPRAGSLTRLAAGAP
jgi:hypothetical protein